MQPSNLMTQAVTISSTTVSGSVDILGRQARSAATTRTTVCRLVRKETMTPDPNVEGLLVSTTTVYVPAGTALKDSDTLTVGGKSYQVLGAPEVLTSPTGGYERATVRLVEATT